jgi:hypothetical protein
LRLPKLYICFRMRDGIFMESVLDGKLAAAGGQAAAGDRDG